MDTVIAPITMDYEEILKMLPHRYPFLLIDRITECVPGKYSKGYKNVSFNEPFFQGHFPDELRELQIFHNSRRGGKDPK